MERGESHRAASGPTRWNSSSHTKARTRTRTVEDTSGISTGLEAYREKGTMKISLFLFVSPFSPFLSFLSIYLSIYLCLLSFATSDFSSLSVYREISGLSHRHATPRYKYYREDTRIPVLSLTTPDTCNEKNKNVREASLFRDSLANRSAIFPSLFPSRDLAVAR